MKFGSRLTANSANLTSKMMQEIKTFVFLDSETTGLPSFENNTTKMTELCLVAVEAEHIRLGVFPRVHNKLNFCFNPRKLISLGSTQITGLSNEMLQTQSHFSANTVHAISSFLNHNQKPVCFVAHNGDRFDFPILRTEISKTQSSLPSDILCVDTLVAFRELQRVEDEENAKKRCPSPMPIEFCDGFNEILCKAVEEMEEDLLRLERVLHVQKTNETTPKKQVVLPAVQAGTSSSSKQKLNLGPSFKLGDVYTKLTNRAPSNVHEAEGDVTMLITCAATLGDLFVDWSNKNARHFSHVPLMVPGRRIGL